LAGRVLAGVLGVVLLVSVGGGAVILGLTEHDDRQEFDDGLRRLAGNLAPGVAGSLGVQPQRAGGGTPAGGGAAAGGGTPPGGGGAAAGGGTPPGGDGAAAGGGAVPPAGGAPPPGNPTAPPPAAPFAADQRAGARRALEDAFLGAGATFVRARTTAGDHLLVGAVPAGFPAQTSGARSVDTAGRTWRTVAIERPRGVFIEVGALQAPLDDRIGRLRRVIAVVVLLGLLLAAILTRLVTRRALKPLFSLTERTTGIRDTADLDARVSEPGAPDEVAALGHEIDGMLARLGGASAAREQALEAARRFAADAGHELRTPLQSVRANLEIARRDKLAAADLATALDSAAAQSDRMNRLVDGLQGLARGEAGLGGAATDVDLGEVAEGAVLEARTRHPGPVVDLVAPPTGPMVSGDSDGLWRVVENLIQNACLHGGTHVRVTVEEGARVIVEDDGPGIPGPDRERVLERFARGNDASAHGSGLGLAIVAAEAARHGGDLKLSQSDLGGLRAEVTVPGQGSR
jgi:signal transduction histidine kinase